MSGFRIGGSTTRGNRGERVDRRASAPCPGGRVRPDPALPVRHLLRDHLHATVRLCPAKLAKNDPGASGFPATGLSGDPAMGELLSALRPAKSAVWNLVDRKSTRLNS